MSFISEVCATKHTTEEVRLLLQRYLEKLTRVFPSVIVIVISFVLDNKGLSQV